MLEEFNTWTSNEVVHNHQAKDQLSTLPARSALTPSSRHPTWHAWPVPVSPSSPGLGPPGTSTKLRQTLIVTAGCGQAQRWGGPIEDIHPGDVIWFEPGEKHWHGTTPTTAMTH